MRDKSSADQLLRHHLRREGSAPRPEEGWGHSDDSHSRKQDRTARIPRYRHIHGLLRAKLIAEHSDTERTPEKKDADFQWSQMHQKAFELIKSSICKETMLAYFDRDKESVIQVDASGKGLGTVLLQDKKPIAYASKSFTDAEKRYANIEQELLAVVFGAERFHTYVYGKRVHRGKRSQTTGDDPAEESYCNATKTAENVVTNTTLRYDDQVPSRQKNYFSQMAYRDFRIRVVNKKSISTSLSISFNSQRRRYAYYRGKPATMQCCVTYAKSS